MSATAVRLHRLPFGTPGGPLVVFAHGLEDSWASWLPVAVELDPSWEMVALDLPWRAGNDYRWHRRPTGYWLGAGLDLLGTRPAALVAHSFGANAAMELLCARDPRPGPVAVLICPLYRPSHQPLTWRLFGHARYRFIEHVREGLRARMGARAGKLDPATLETMMDVALDRVGPSGFLTAFREFMVSTDLQLGDIGVATLVIAGAADPSLPPAAARALRAAIPNASLRINAEFDHFCHVRQARGVAAQITNFLSSRISSRTVGDPQ